MLEDEEDETIQSAKKRNFLVPDKINQVVLLQYQLSKDNETRMKSDFDNFEFEESQLPEFKPLAFTVSENFFDLESREIDSKKSNPKSGLIYKKSPNVYLEKRGLLQFINAGKKRNFLMTKIGMVMK